MATVGLGTDPWVVGDAIAHQDFEIHWEDSVDTSDGVTHTGHSDHLVVYDDANRPIVDEWVEAAVVADGGNVHLLYKIAYPGLREGLYTAVVYVDSNGKDPSATGQCSVPVTYSGEGVAKAGEEFALRLNLPWITEDFGNPSAVEPTADRPFIIMMGVFNDGPFPSPGAHQTSCSITGSGGGWEDDSPANVPAVAVGEGQLAHFHCPGLPAGVYRAEMWVDLVTTMQPVSTTFDFTIQEADAG